MFMIGRVAREMGRVPVLCEINEDYARVIEEGSVGYYNVRRNGEAIVREKECVCEFV